MDHALDRKTALSVFAGLTLVYWLGRAELFGPGDSAQHVTSALTWGVSKAPGYPLYTALAHLFSWIAPGARAAAVNGFSGVLHAYAAALFYLLMRRQGAGMPGALAATGLLAFGRLFWFYSGVAEVRALNDLLALAAASAALTYADNGPKGSLLALAAACGLGVSHHPTFVLVLPAVLYLAATGRRKPSARDAAVFAGASAAACAAPYLVLWLRLKAGEPAYNFEQARTLADVAGLFLRSSTGGPLKMFPGEGLLGFSSFSFAKLFKHAGWFVSTAGAELGPAGLVLLGLGIWSARKCGRKWLAFWGLWLAGTVSYFLLVSSQTFPVYDEGYARAVLARFYLLPLIALIAPAAFGAQWLFERVRPALGWALCASVALIPALLRPMNHNGRRPLPDYARHVLASSRPDDMLILAADDSLFAARYLDAVEGALQDRVVLVPGFFRAPSYARALRARHPGLNLPTDLSGNLSEDWRQWLALNPERRLLTEGVLLATAKRLFPKAQPSGVLIELTDKPLPRKRVLEETQRFLDMAEGSGVSKWSVREFTQEIFVSRVYRQMAVFHGTHLTAKDLELSMRLENLYYGL